MAVVGVGFHRSAPGEHHGVGAASDHPFVGTQASSTAMRPAAPGADADLTPFEIFSAMLHDPTDTPSSSMTASAGTVGSCCGCSTARLAISGRPGTLAAVVVRFVEQENTPLSSSAALR